MLPRAVARAKALRLNLTRSLGFWPALIVLLLGALAIGLVELDKRLDLGGTAALFGGDASAARTVLSVIAGSLITVAGLTFSTTMVVLQLASSQFSPRVLRTFFGDRVTQITIGLYVGTFVYCLLVLRSIGSDFVPRLSMTVASAFGIAAGALLVVFLQHVSRLVAVSHVTARIAHDALARADVLYPDRYGVALHEGADDDLLDAWRAQPAAAVVPPRPGYVQRVGLDDLVDNLPDEVERVAVLVCPGDFVSVETAMVELWPAGAAQRCERTVHDAVSIASERDPDQDVGFALRQLADIALRALSPGVNDPMTAITCISYARAILVRLTDRGLPEGERRFPDRALTVMVRRRSYAEHLECLRQIGRYVGGDAWVAGELLQALQACAEIALDCGASDRLREIHRVAAMIAEQAVDEAKTEADRERIERLMGAIPG